jgi:WD40 repeat protein
MFIDECVTVVGDRLVTVNKSGDIEVRLVLTGQVVQTIHSGDDIICITPVPGHPELLVTGHRDGAVHLWDIEKGARACECRNECRRARAPSCATCESVFCSRLINAAHVH